MNTLDKKFEQLMKGISIDSPSKGFTLKVMERIQAEAAVQKHSILEDYQPVISRNTWIVLIVAFISMVVYILFAGQEISQVHDTTLWSAIPDAMKNINIKGVTNIWQSATSLIVSIPSVVYLIMIASMALWSLDLFLTRLRHSSSLI
jgi:hypothetical protein